MPQLVADCLKGWNLGPVVNDWDLAGDRPPEMYSICRHCNRGAIFTILFNNVDSMRDFMSSGVNSDASLNRYASVCGFVSIADVKTFSPPDFIVGEMKNIFCEGATCFSVQCFNAAATMFRLCVDLATRPLLPPPEATDTPQPNSKQRRDLGLRLP